MMVKPGYNWNATAITTVSKPPVSTSPILASSLEPLSVPNSSPLQTEILHPEAHSKQGGRRHQRIPSAILYFPVIISGIIWTKGERYHINHRSWRSLQSRSSIWHNVYVSPDHVSTWILGASSWFFEVRLPYFIKLFCKLGSHQNSFSRLFFYRNKLRTPINVHSMFEDFLCEGTLTVSEITKIRDVFIGTWVLFRVWNFGWNH